MFNNSFKNTFRAIRPLINRELASLAPHIKPAFIVAAGIEAGKIIISPERSCGEERVKTENSNSFSLRPH
jgi:hypothetical protein